MRDDLEVGLCGATRRWHDWLRRVAASVLLGSALASPIHSDVGERATTLTPNAEDALAAAPDAVAARIRLAQTFVASARYAEAIDEYRQIIALAPDSGVQEDLARTLVLAGRYAEGVTEYRSLVARVPKDRWLRRSLARALAADDRRTEAIPLLDALVEEDPRDTETLIERALIARWQGDFATARRLFRRASSVEHEQRPTEGEAPGEAAAAADAAAEAEAEAAEQSAVMTAAGLAPGGPGPDVTLPLLVGFLGLGIASGQLQRNLGLRSYLLLVTLSSGLVVAAYAWLCLAP